MLKHRILTALVLAPLVIWGILAFPTAGFGLLLALFVAVGAWEWAALIGWPETTQRIVYSVFITLALLLVFFSLESSTLVVSMLSLSAVWWIFSLFFIANYRGEVHINTAAIVPNALLGMILLVGTWLALVTLHRIDDKGPLLVLFVMTLVWVADIGAYFIGKRFGKNKLAPYVSPGKTREGAYGAFVATGIYTLIAGMFWLDMSGAKLLVFVLMCIVIVAFSIVGDLLESLYKRKAGVKDSGSIFPGHGGVLDRIDSITAAAPLFALGYTMLESSS